MAFFTYLTNPDTVLELFESVQAGILVIDQNHRVVLANRAFGELYGEKPNCLAGTTHCYNLMFNREETCEDCPGLDLTDDNWPKQKSVVMKRVDGNELLIKVFYRKWIDHFVLTLHDVTKEVNLLRKVGLNKKELQAKNILLERRRREVSEERQLLEQLWANLPEALMTVSKSFTIERQNNAVGRIMPESGGKKCFELIGHGEMCPGCPAQAVGFQNVHEGKKSHEIKGRYLTEIINPAPSGEGGLLLFRDTTRQIHLIEEIRKQREAITRKNEILANLVDFSAYMQKETDAVKVIRYFIDLFLAVLRTDGIAVIVDDARVGNLKLTECNGINDEQMNALTRAYLSREIQSLQQDVIPQEVIPFAVSTQIVLHGGSDRRVGLVVVAGDFQQENAELVKLFIEPLGPYIHNQLLMQQLEEKANTDAMTGMFNRGYMDQTLLEEKAKYEKYQIHYAAVVVDVNGLKKANDMYGHEAGDALICTVAKLLASAVRQSDIVARTGGDEFLILLTNTTTSQAENFVNRLDTVIFKDAVMDVGDTEKFPVSISLGAASTENFDPESVIKEADRKMYAFKENFYKTRQRYR